MSVYRSKRGQVYKIEYLRKDPVGPVIHNIGIQASEFELNNLEKQELKSDMR